MTLKRKLTHLGPTISSAIQALLPHSFYMWVPPPGESVINPSFLKELLKLASHWFIEMNTRKNIQLQNNMLVFSQLLPFEDMKWKTSLMWPWTRRRRNRWDPTMTIPKLLLFSSVFFPFAFNSRTLPMSYSCSNMASLAVIRERRHKTAGICRFFDAF